MKRILIILLFVFSLTSFGLDLSSVIKTEFNLAEGIVLPELTDISDFSNIKSSGIHPSTKVDVGPLFDDGIANGWYVSDFASDPFDGVIEIYMVGQPSASVNATLAISLAAVLILLYKKKQFITI